jgi:hypothetical protein
VLFSACVESASFDRPPAPPAGVRSALVAFESDGALDLVAVDLAESEPLSRPFTARGSPTVTILYVSASLAEIRVAPGPVSPAAGDPTRSLPPFAAAYRTTSIDPVGEWEPIDALSDRLAAFRIPGYDVDECLAIGGCFLSPEDVVQKDCRLPCNVLAPALPAEPEPPDPPRMEPCPAGWSATVVEAFVSCEPPARVPCTGASLQTAGDAACRPIGAPCPAGLYGGGLPAQVLYVDPAAALGGDGTIGAPYRDLAVAIGAAPDGGALALAKGTHAPFTTSKSVRLIGACAAETILSDRSFLDGGVIRLEAITLSGGVAVRGADATLDATLILGPSPIDVTAGSVSLVGSAVRGTGTAIRATLGSVSIDCSSIEGSPAGAIDLTGAAAAIGGSAITGTRGSALSASGSPVEIRETLIEGTAASYVVDIIEGSTFDAEHLVIRDSIGRSEDGDAYAIRIDRSNVVVSKAAIVRAVQHGIAAETATVALRDLFVDGVRAPERPRSVDRDLGQGVYVSNSSATVERAFLRDTVWAGLRAVNDADLTARDIAIAGVAQPVSWRAIAGLHIERSKVDAERVRVIGADTEGVLGYTAVGSIADLTVEVDGPTPDETGTECGLDLAGASDILVARARLQRLYRQGLCVVQSATAEISDYTAVDVGDHGLYVHQEGTATADRVRIDGAADAVVAFLETELTITDLTVQNAHGNVRYVPLNMLGRPRGRGVFNNAMSRIVIERFDIRGSADTGLDLGSRDSVRLADGLVTDCVIGARIPIGGLSLLTGVVITGNRSQNIEMPLE